MSTNIHIQGERDMCLFDKVTKQADTSRVWSDCNNFGVWQTPSKVTAEIMKSADKAQAYIDWVMTISLDKQEPVYASNDLFCDGEPIGFKIVNEAKEHVKQFKEWIDLMKIDKFIVSFESW